MDLKIDGYDDAGRDLPIKKEEGRMGDMVLGRIGTTSDYEIFYYWLCKKRYSSIKTNS